MMDADLYYWMACEHAKDDYFTFGIRRTDEEVEREAARLRMQDTEGSGADGVK